MAYAADQLKLALGRRTVMWIKKQTARGTLAEPATGDTVLKTGRGTFKQNFDYEDDKQLRDTFDELQGSQGALPHGELDFTCYLKPSGTAGTDPECTDILEGAFGSKLSGAADTVQAAPAPTVSGCTVTDGTRFSKGQVRLVEMTAGPTAVTITDVSTNALTWEPALSVAPASGANIYAAIQYKPATDLSDYSIWMKDDDRVFAYQDCSFSKLSGKFDKKSSLELAVNGGFVKFFMAGSDELAVACTDVATTLTFKDGKKFLAGAGCIIKLESEIIRVDSVSGNVGTVTRAYMSTTAAAHAIDTPITPWSPTVTETGVPLHGKYGKPKWKLGSTWESLPYLEFSYEFDNALGWADEEVTGEDEGAGSFRNEVRKVTGTMSFLYRRKHSNLYAHSKSRTLAQVLVPVFSAVGKGFAIHIPQAEFLIPEIGGDAEQRVTLPFKIFASSAYNDTLTIHSI